MSAYFDKRATEIDALRKAGKAPWDSETGDWLRALRDDMSIVCEFDRGGPWAFPADLRDAVYTLLLRHDPEAWPSGLAGEGVDYETEEQGMTLFAHLVSRLHDLFHAAAHADWPGRDNPRSAVLEMGCRRQDRCEALILANPALRVPRPPPIQTQP